MSYRAPEFTFPAPQHMVPAPGEYVPPPQFYDQGLSGEPFSQASGPSVDSDVDDVSTVRKRVHSESPEPARPAKRGRGRPPGSKNKPKTGAEPSKPRSKAPTQSRKNTTITSTAKTTQKSKTNQENIPPSPINLLDDSDDDTERTEDGKIHYWQPAEKTRAFEFILGPDADRRFEQHKVNPGHVYRRISERVFNGARNVNSIKSMYSRALETFAWIRAFTDFTGNGGGDGDCDGDAEAILNQKLVAARKSGLPLGDLKPATIDQWEKLGWTDLFMSRLGNSAKVARKVVRSSAAALSDLENDDDSDKEVDPMLRKRKPAAAVVTEPKHTPASAFRKQVGNSFSGLGDFMKIKAAAEEKKAAVLDARLAFDREKLDMEKTRGKVDIAEKILSMPGASDQARDAANAFLLTLFH
ncbi:hypothetical protein B0H16DRAFT_967733 [Mycena metata]|uniref:Uncharacterized protein n=1 Tax=Mycena metata TaxID=1033252 RepID=A0AAD7ILR3_9AGAR|nr:hypothetical protein B0H16DRAFT_967733 [Mycena metata]